jgi:hypothetical protein
VCSGNQVVAGIGEKFSAKQEAEPPILTRVPNLKTRDQNHAGVGAMEIIVKKPNLNIKTFHIDGRDCGESSICSWTRIETGIRVMWTVPPVPELEAGYKALQAVLKCLAHGSRATICTHSYELWDRFNDAFLTPDQEVAELFEEAQQLIRKKKLKIQVRYILHEDNKAVLPKLSKQRKTRWRRLGTTRRR